MDDETQTRHVECRFAVRMEVSASRTDDEIAALLKKHVSFGILEPVALSISVVGQPPRASALQIQDEHFNANRT